MLNRRILIVDDNVDIHADFRKVLSSRPREDAFDKMERALFGEPAVSSEKEVVYEIDSAYQGLEGLEMAERAAANNRPYALVFMDGRMPPGRDGIETTKMLWERLPFTEVILCTAFSDHSSEDIQRMVGDSHRLLILKKPFDAVAVKQMALTLTSKWNFEHGTRDHAATLERTVHERTSELRRAVENLERMNLDLDLSLRRTQQAQRLLIEGSKMSALGVMAGGVAHEINTPLTTLTLNVDMVDEALNSGGALDLELVRMMNEANRKITGRIAKIVGGLRNFCRDGSRDPFSRVPARSVIVDAIALCEEKMKNHGVKLQVISPSEDIFIEGRPVELSQVVLNLINNAYDAIQTRPEKWIRIELSTQDSRVKIAVTDSGQGIAEHVRTRIFEPFFTTKEVGRGTGLGLSISIGIMSAHRGNLEYDEECPNTRFVMSLPGVAA